MTSKIEHSRPESTYLAIDLVLQALIGPDGAAIEGLIAQATTGRVRLVISDRAIYCAVASLRDTDKVNFSRFAALLQYATIQSSRTPPDAIVVSKGPPRPEVFSSPSPEEIEHWRKIALGLGRSWSLSPPE